LTAGVGGQSRTSDWASSNYDGTSNRYSPLDQITPQNVAKLERVWSIHLKPEGYTQRLREMEAVPLVIGNMMYLASPYGAILALDAPPAPRNDSSCQAICRRSAASRTGPAPMASRRRSSSAALAAACIPSRPQTARTTPASGRTAF
jgi:hypothetical protein